MVEEACNKSGDRVKLLGFYQGSQLWNNVEVYKVTYDQEGRMHDSEETEILPHRPDAFFALQFPDRAGEDETVCYFYEADRHRTSIKKMQKKLRSHFHYIVKQKRHLADYGVKRIRAVLVESIDDQ
jgi:hypothetical protein